MNGLSTKNECDHVEHNSEFDSRDYLQSKRYEGRKGLELSEDMVNKKASYAKKLVLV